MNVVKFTFFNLQGFADEIISVEERYDSFDRSIQLVPVVKQERGALRWLGDMIFNGLGRKARI